MVLDKEKIIKKLKEIKPLLQDNYDLKEIALFGSYARGDATADSYIDILIRLAKPSYRNLCNAAYILYDIFPHQKVQVVSKGGIKPQYFQRLKNDLIYA